MSARVPDKAAREAAAKRMANLTAFYADRQKAATSNRELAQVVVDQAKAIARAAEKNGDDSAWYSLAQDLSAWCNQHGG
ncbi:hypothetical protein [Kitasatospora sp. NPDC059327]|uniref:hypothetical protein n=1 Tax=Kitasatospora sp. NPDC059327 TaxID=3346803 RepID=UPI003696CAC1